jgi:hypothetical protein
MDCILKEKCVRLSLVDVRRSAVLLQRLPSQPVALPMQLEDFMLWKCFYSLEDPCPAALTIILHVRIMRLCLQVPNYRAQQSWCTSIAA